MTQPSQSSEHPSTYIVQDRENQEELARLTLQDRLLTESMGGVLAELPEPAALQRVLDIGCATGGWALETAQTYPTISLVIGIDISQRMITYARQQAQAAALAERVEFHVMDALRMLEFPSHFFDLVNLRLGGAGCAPGTGRSCSAKSIASHVLGGSCASLSRSSCIALAARQGRA